MAAGAAQATEQLDAFDISGYAATVYELAWSDYCDWFLEMAKVDLRREGVSDAERSATWTAAAATLATLLRLLHPLMPFVTEEIWGALREAAPDATGDEPLLIRAPWPTSAVRDGGAEAAFDDLASLVRGIRNLRTEGGTPAGAWVPLFVEPTDAVAAEMIRSGRPYIEALGRVRPIEIGEGRDRPQLLATGPLGAAWLGTDAAAGEDRRRRQIEELDANIARLRDLLANGAFTSRVERERQRLGDLETERRQLDGAG
jgi:valyl-tRNA synthetase